MNARTQAFTLDGVSASPVAVEVEVHRGLPAFSVVGLPDTAVREARERVRAALANCGFEFPLRRIVVNLAPVSLRKAGPALDLAIANALLMASGQFEWRAGPPPAMIGELALDGSVRPGAGALVIAEAARELGCPVIVVPAENGPEAALAAGIDIVPIGNLGELPKLAAGEWAPNRPAPLSLAPKMDSRLPDLADLRGQRQLKRALEFAAAGGHSLLIVGPPGSGKALAATRLPSILPPLTEEEALEVARIAGVCRRLDTAPVSRPFRAPHHTISPLGLFGGSSPIRPGEATLAHRGVLFLDELCEFRRDTLEALRSPVETGWVSISQPGTSQRFPCRFTLVAAANPCPCGRGEVDPDCRCSPLAIERYRARLNGALPDCFDLVVAIVQPSAAEIAGPPGEASRVVRERVIAARERQERRLGKGRCNGDVEPGKLLGFALSEGAQRLMDRLGGARCNRALSVARTLADLAGQDEIGEEQMAEALALQKMDYR